MDLFRRKSVRQTLEQPDVDGHPPLSRHLGVRDLTSLGIAAIVGAGIFSTIGKASADGGPGVVLLFLFTAVACGFAAFAYAEFASMVPVSGSAYTYSYVAFGEIVAWIIGWALIMEYAIGNITVAISWSDYFTGLLSGMGIDLPAWMTMDYLSAMNGSQKAEALMAAGKDIGDLDGGLRSSYDAWTSAPQIGSFHFVADLPALMIIVLITWLVYRGVRESRNAGNMMVGIKIAVVLLVILVGAFYVDTDRWNPFLPNGIPGVLKGVSAVFFAYIGFDAISTTAEECKNPQRDLPRGMMWSILICTVLYIAIALVLTGMVPSGELNVGDPLAFVFQKLDLTWMSGIIGVSAIVAMASVLLVFQLGQPRIWMSMSRDGLLPKRFSTIHPKYRTPSFATVITGFVVAVPALFMNLTMVTDLCSIGTLFAFVLVCGGVLRLESIPDAPRGSFRTPYINSRYIFSGMVILAFVSAFTIYRNETMNFLRNDPVQRDAGTLVSEFSKEESAEAIQYIASTDPHGWEESQNDLEAYLSALTPDGYYSTVAVLPVPSGKKTDSGWDVFKHKIPFWIFLVTVIILSVISWRKQLSLIPLLGLVSCLYMMSELGVHNWIGFGVWLAVGLVIYFGYSYKRSRLGVSG
jgi:amino acid transporter